jgi:hypothetical protein
VLLWYTLLLLGAHAAWCSASPHEAANTAAAAAATAAAAADAQELQQPRFSTVELDAALKDAQQELGHLAAKQQWQQQRQQPDIEQQRQQQQSRQQQPQEQQQQKQKWQPQSQQLEQQNTSQQQQQLQLQAQPQQQLRSNMAPIIHGWSSLVTTANVVFSWSHQLLPTGATSMSVPWGYGSAVTQARAAFTRNVASAEYSFSGNLQVRTHCGRG